MTNFNLKYAFNFDGLDMISHGYFGRAGGVSKGKYASLNAGHGSNDDQKHITENRNRIAYAVGTSPKKLISNHQCHTNVVVTITSPFKQAPPKADGMVTNVPKLALSTLSADCAPVLFIDPMAKVIGAAHAGWRGALSGITDNTIDKMESLGAHRKNIRACIGPCIGQKNLEVGPEFVTAFIMENPGHAIFFQKGKKDRSLFNIKSYLVQKLERAGIKSASALPQCTYAQHQNYFSYRYNCHNDITDYGRNISVIMLNE
ncbi:MAG: peptidoglycan editing factor PgeF [Robiginitomaculum sp.]